MTRIHVRLMHEQRGYTAAKKILIERKARGEFFVQLEYLERARREAERRRTHGDGAAHSYLRAA